MYKVIKLVQREYKAAVKTKGFIIGLIIAPIFMGGSLIAFALLKDRVDTNDKKVALLDHSGVIAQAIIEAAEYHNTHEIYDTETGKKIKPAYFFEKVEPDEKDIQNQRLALSDRVRYTDLHAFVEIGPEIIHPGENQDGFRVKYHAKNAAMDELRGWIVWPINNKGIRCKRSVFLGECRWPGTGFCR